VREQCINTGTSTLYAQTEHVCMLLTLSLSAVLLSSSCKPAVVEKVRAWEGAVTAAAPCSRHSGMPLLLGAAAGICGDGRAPQGEEEGRRESGEGAEGRAGPASAARAGQMPRATGQRPHTCTVTHALCNSPLPSVTARCPL